MKRKSRFFAAAGLVVLAAALLFTGCQNPAGGPPGDITYNVSADGASGTTTSTAISFSFSQAVDLAASDIQVGAGSDTGSVSVGALSGSGTSWDLALTTVTSPGVVTVTINRAGIESAAKTVTVHKQGVSTPVSFTVPAALQGKWIAGPQEINEITATRYKSGVGYEGEIVNVIPDAGGASGYIIIRFDPGPSWYVGSTGKYYAIRYENLSTGAGTKAEIYGAYLASDADNGGGSGKATREEAESVYLSNINYFIPSGSRYNFYKEQDSFAFPSGANAILGTWLGGSAYDYNFLITEKTVACDLNYTVFVIGDIVNVTGNASDGYITFKYRYNYESGTGADTLLGQYCVLHWESASSTANIDIAYDSSIGDEGKTTQGAAESSYDSGYSWDLYSYTKQ
ncbi:MAG: hypothetical protein LBQ55_08095 [Treponema sp.]|jgi:hypothetical protein|nr:hypothetical protein [Treponema sp.]